MPKHQLRESGVPCPRCGSRLSDVKDSRPSSTTIRRRRTCRACKAKFTTHEVSLERYNFLQDVDLDAMRVSAVIMIDALDQLKRLRDNE